MTDGVSVVRIVNTFWREQKQEKEGKAGKEEKAEQEKIKKNQNKVDEIKPSPTKRNSRPPGSPKKRMICSPRKRLSIKDIGKINRYP